MIDHVMELLGCNRVIRWWREVTRVETYRLGADDPRWEEPEYDEWGDEDDEGYSVSRSMQLPGVPETAA